MDRVPNINISTTLVTVLRVEIREVSAIEVQFAVAPEVRGGILLPCSNTRSKALFHININMHTCKLKIKSIDSSHVTKIQASGIELDSIPDFLVQNRLEND